MSTPQGTLKSKKVQLFTASAQKKTQTAHHHHHHHHHHPFTFPGGKGTLKTLCILLYLPIAAIL
jgi:hypothetical protein